MTQLFFVLPSILASELQSNLRKVATWFHNNNLTLNVKKTKYMVFGTRHILDKFNDITLQYDDDHIEHVNQFKYLGVVFDSSMSWSEHISKLSADISKRCGIIKRVKYYIPKHILTMLANAIVMPNFDYCSPV